LCLHLHHLKNLEADTTYHYRFAAVDERGNRIATKDGTSTTRRVWDTLYSPVFLSRPSQIESAGLTVDYHGDQVVALGFITPGQKCDIHHNRFVDRGTTLFDRHVGMDVIAMGAGDSTCHGTVTVQPTGREHD